MRRTHIFAFLICCGLWPVACGLAVAQQTPTDYNVSHLLFSLTDPPQAVNPTTISVQKLDNPAACSYHYWVVAKSPIGNASPSGPAPAFNAACTLTNGNRVSWTSAAGATAYDVLRTTTAKPPQGACGCAVATSVSSTTVTDTGTLSAYTVNTFDPSTVSFVSNNEGCSSSLGALIFRAAGAPAFTITTDGVLHQGNCTGPSISGGGPVGPAGGDLSGTYPNPTVANVQGVSYSGCIAPSTNTVPVVTGVNAVTCEAVPNAALSNSSITISGHVIALGGSQNLINSDVGLGNVTNDAQTKAAILPNTAPGSGQIPIGNAGGTAYAPHSVSGDASLTSAGVLTVASVNAVSYPASPGTNTVPVVTALNTVTYEAVPNAALANNSITISGHVIALGGSQNLTNADVGLGNVTNDAQTKAAIVPNTLPAAGQILIGNAGGTAYAPNSLSGDATLTSAGVLTVSNSAITNAKLANMAGNTVKANVTNSSAAPSDASVPSCTDTAGNHLNYTLGTGFSCGNTSSGGGTLAFSSLTSGTNTTAAMVVGTGSSLGVSGSGTIAATSLTTGTTNTLLKSNGASPAGNSSVTDDGTNPTRAPNGLDTATGGDYEEYTVDTGGVTAGLALCVTANVDGAGRPKVLPCSHTATQPGAGFVGMAQATVAAAGTVEVCWTVNCSVTFDNASTALNEAILSVTTDGQLHDTGSQTATAGQPNFAVLNANTGAGTKSLVSLTGMLAQNPKGGGGNGKGVTANTTTPSIPYLSAANTYSDSPLFRFDANTIEQRNSTTTQTLKIYHSYTSSSTNHGISISGGTITTFANGADVADAITINSLAGPFSLEVGSSPVIQLTTLPSIKLLGSISVYAVASNPSAVGNTAGAGGLFIGGSVSANAISTASVTNTALTVGATTGATGPGDYWFVWMYQCQTAVAGAQVTGTISWTDRNSNSHSRSITLDCSSTSNDVSASFVMNVKASQTVSVTTVITNGGGTAAYDARFSAIQLN